MALALLPLVSQAHHSRSAFNLDETVVVEGTVTEVGWTNPHYYLAVRSDNSGQSELWTFEGHSIPGLVRNGWRKDTLEVGSRVSVVANPNQAPSVKFGLINHVTRRDGKTFHSFRPTDEILNTPKPPLEPSTDFTGTWRVIRSLRANLVGGFEPPSDWPLTDTGKREVAKFDINDDPSLDCEPRGNPRMLNWPYSQKWQSQGENLFITIEHAVETRTLFGSATDLLPPETYNLGQSRIMSRSDKELLVESRGFAAKRWGLTRGLSSGPEKIVTERYELVEDGYRLKLEVTIEDPLAITEPVTDTIYYAKVHDFEFAEEPPCDVASARRHLEFERD